MNEKFKELIISSGGIKGISILGALSELEKHHIITDFIYYTGCSYGALICILINIGYTINDIISVVFKLDLENFQDIKFANLLDKCGLDEGIKYTNFLKALFLNKNIDLNITFKQLYILTNKTLTITVSNVTSGIPEYHNHINTPDFSILLSLRMTTNIPILFPPILYNENYYLDGALLDPFPYLYTKNISLSEKLGICLFDNYEFNFMNNNNTNFITETSNSFNYIVNLVKIIHINYLKLNYKKTYSNVIYINYDTNKTLLTADKLSDSEKDEFFNVGVKKAKIYINRKNTKNIKFLKIFNNKILLKKYFNIWKK